MITVTITFDDARTHQIELSDTAREAVHINFNPSGFTDVHIIKALAAAFITVLEGCSMHSADKDTSIQLMKAASMCAVTARACGL
jgi:hypothetical protein